MDTDDIQEPLLRARSSEPVAITRATSRESYDGATWCFYSPSPHEPAYTPEELERAISARASGPLSASGSGALSADLALPSLGEDVHVYAGAAAAAEGALPAVVTASELQSPAQFTFNCIKMTLGTASFALPWGFMKAGLVGGVVGTALVGVLVFVTMSMLVSCKHELEGKLRRHPNYAEMAEAALGRWARHLVMFATAASCLGACAGYLTFVGSLVSHQLPQVTQEQVVLAITPLFALLSLLRTYRLISFFSLIGDLSLFCATALVFYDGFTHHGKDLKPPLEYPMFHPETYMLFFGPTTFLFTIHYCMLPMESELQEPRSRVYPSMAVSTAFCTLMDILIGALGYMFYGDNTQGIVLNNLQPGPVTQGIIFMLALELCLTYVLLLAPPRQYLEAELLRRVPARHAALLRCAAMQAVLKQCKET